MIKILRLETLAIEGDTKEEVQTEIDKYIAMGYELTQPIINYKEENVKDALNFGAFVAYNNFPIDRNCM